MWLWPLVDGFSAVAVAVWPSSPELWLVPLVDPRDADSLRRRPSSGGVSLAWIWLASTRGVFSGACGSRFCLRLSLSLVSWLLRPAGRTRVRCGLARLGDDAPLYTA